jgi:hypothetical protein
MFENIKTFVENNPKLVTCRESIRYPGLFVVKYTRKVFYDNLWTPELEECRGLVVDKDWKPVILPFKKIYNRGERGTDFSLDQRVTAVRKINGFMAAATYVKDHGVIVSTTGSLDSDFVGLAEKWLRPDVTNWIRDLGHNITWLFEICDPSDPHIIPEEPGAYLIGARLHYDGGMAVESSLDTHAKHMGVLRPQVVYNNILFSTVLDLVKNCQHEGFVVHGPSMSLKIKSPYYLINKFLARKKGDRLIDLLADIPSFRKTVDEEFYPLLDYLEGHIDFPSMNEQDRLTVIQNFLTS